MRERLQYYDFLKGIAIIAVVAIHSSNYGDIEEAFQYLSGGILWRTLICFAVPLFVTTSGFFMANKNISTKVEYLAFLKKQLTRILIPYLIWSGIILISYTGQLSIKESIIRLTTFQASAPYYFMALICQFYILLPLMQKLASIKGLILSGVISIFSLLVIGYLRYDLNWDLPLVACAGIFPTYILFFVLGICLGKKVITLKSNYVLIVLTLLSFAASLFDAHYVYQNTKVFNQAVTALKPSAFIYSFFLTILLFNNADKTNGVKFISTIGYLSFGVYLVHVIYLRRIATLLMKIFNGIENNQLLFQFLLIGTTVASCILTSFIAKKIHKQFAERYLGL